MAHIMNRAGWIVAGVLALLVVAALTGIVHGGPLDPPAGVPAPTMKTLQQVEPRTPIESLPFTISTSGSYYLTGNLTGSVGSNGINVVASNVTIDLRGFALIGPGGTGTETGISAAPGSGVANLTVMNGTIRDWAGNGIYVFGTSARLTDLRILHNALSATAGQVAAWVSGIGNVVTGCTIQGNGTSVASWALFDVDGTVSNCTATFNTGTPSGITPSAAIYITNGVLRDCVVIGNLSQFGVFADYSSRVSGCTVSYNAHDGILTSNNGNLIEHNVANGNSGAGIHLSLPGIGNRVEENNVYSNGTGIKADSGSNVIVRNSLDGNTTAYSIVAGNTVGDTTNAAGTVPTTPWANINY